MSLAAMEATLRPKVLEILEQIAANYAQLSEMQEQRMAATMSSSTRFTTTEEGAYQKLRGEMVLLVNELHLNNSRIEALIDQLYGINKRIMSINSGMVKLADAARINRQEFIAEYQGFELDPSWVRRMAEKSRSWLADPDREEPRKGRGAAR